MKTKIEKATVIFDQYFGRERPKFVIARIERKAGTTDATARNYYNRLRLARQAADQALADAKAAKKRARKSKKR